ncbi:ABC transporter permease [Rhodanobacter sp. 115]|jgi:putative ABC transport system permease protein|uniref:ABC transporter permease n=1 Tax=Rhodanobacter sp. FW021-MT20 TaxID=1162282 RepID=UPI000260EC9D|nr:FtsX-like permease family protein [Rhodanobacter sp. 115]EIL87816.1 ABC transporter [Rhodanobacter sp. 115]
MSIRVLLTTLRRHSLMPLLVLLQVALACAILSNVLFLGWLQLQPMLAPSGMDTANLIFVDHLDAGTGEWTAAEVRAGAEALREVPGVRAVSAANSLPMTSGMIYAYGAQGPSGIKVGVNAYTGNGLLHTLGIRLIAGRDFLPDEYRNAGDYKGVPEPIIITQALAHKLFDKARALGRRVADPENPTGAGYLVVGIVRHLLRNQLGLATRGRADDTILLPERIAKTPVLLYAVRVDPAMRKAALRGVRKAIQHQFGARLQTGAQPKVAFYDTRSSQAFSGRRAALWLFLGVASTVLVVTLIGIMGLTGFWVQKRTRQIGIRRALGARRADILVHFLTENALIVGAGIVLGMLLASLGNRLLMHYYELPQLPWIWLPVGAALMLALGQLAVLSPALRASRVPPVVATRSV